MYKGVDLTSVFEMGVAAESLKMNPMGKGEEATGLDALHTHLTACDLNLRFSTVLTKSFTSAFPHVENTDPNKDTE
ncbi:hypothetical protein Bca4012_069190 [Brassica carinata]